MVEDRVLDEATARAAAEQAREAGLKLGAFLLRQGFPPPDVLARTMTRHVRGLLDDTAAWKGATYRFERGIPDLGGEPLADLPVAAWLLESSSSLMRGRPEDLRARIGPPGARIEIVDAARKRLDGVALDAVTRFALDACDGTRTLRALEESTQDGVSLLQRLYTLVLLGVARPKEETAGAGVRAVSREEAEARLAQAQSSTATHYLVLGVNNDATPDQIRAGYYELARRFHPDRFRSGLLQDLLPQIEAYFAKVTEAYNTLSEPIARAEYDERLAGTRPPEDEPKKDAAYLARENYAKARVLIDRRQYQDAVTFLENAIDLDVKTPYLLELGRLLTRNPRQRQEALGHLRQATTLDPTHAPSWTALGELYARLDRPDQARDAFEKALHWDPTNGEAADGLARLGGKDAPGGKDEGKGLFGGLFGGRGDR